MSADELEALAAKGREQQRREAEQREREARARERSAQREADETLRRSLEGWGVVSMVLTFVGFHVIVGVIWAIDNAFPELPWKKLWYTLLIGSACLLPYFGMKSQRERELRWIRSIPYPFDADGYIAGLRARQSGNTNVEVRVSFLRPVDAAAKRTIADALLAAVGECHASWQADELIIKSIAFETTKWVKKGDDNEIVAYNGKLHRWFRRCVDQGLSKVHPAYGITSLRVTYV